MGALTKIQWCDHTFNPVVGCTKVSAACDFCYAEKWALRAGRPELWQGDRQRTSPHNWKEPLRWNATAKAEGRRAKVFCASLADVFDNQWDPQWRADLVTLINKTPCLDWLLLTKRPQNIAKMWPSAFINPHPWFPNVWFGTTVESQQEADRRIPHLLNVPAVMRFLSIEPLLEAIEIGQWLPRISWAIIGGESGAANRRPFSTTWAIDLIRQCRATGPAVFVKQLGSNVFHRGQHLSLKDKKGGDPLEWPEELRVREFPRVMALA